MNTATDNARRAPRTRKGGMAIVHEWIAAYAGSEQVFESMAQAFPSADLIALSNDPGITLDTGGRSIRTTFLDRKSLRNRRAATLPLMPLAWRTLGTAQYDVVLTSHHAFAHSHRLAADGVHLAYVHSPARYIWAPDLDRRGAGALLSPARALLRTLDRRASRHVTAYAANSTEVARRIQEVWKRDATVIHPPVRTDFFGATAETPPSRDYVLGVGRWIRYKMLHRVVEAADAAGLPVKVAGRGPDKDRLIAAAERATVPVELIESPTDHELRELYRNAACLVFPSVEDFGLVPVEAQAAGTPVVALGQGGAVDTVLDGTSGVLVSEASPTALAVGIRKACGMSGDGPRASAARFTSDRFHEALHAWVREHTG